MTIKQFDERFAALAINGKRCVRHPRATSTWPNARESRGGPTCGLRYGPVDSTDYTDSEFGISFRLPSHPSFCVL